MSRTALLTDAQWDRIKEFMPSSEGKRGRPFRDHRLVLEGIIYRFRTGSAWRDLPSEFGAWQTVWERHDRYARDGTYDRIHARLAAVADEAGDLDWMLPIDSTAVRAHQHATNTNALIGHQRASQGAEQNYMFVRGRPADEPLDHAISRSRGGLTTKIHQLVDGRGRPVEIIVTAGQAGDSPVLKHLLDQVKVELGFPS